MEEQNDLLFPKPTADSAKKRAALAPNQIDAWRKFSRAVFKDGALDAKTKHLIAISVAHVTQCPYCIRAHVPQALKLGATREEIMEAIWVAAAGSASGGYQHAAISVHQMEINDGLQKEDGAKFPENDPIMAAKKAKLAPDIVEAWRGLSNSVFKENLLSEKTKQLIALGISHVTQCSYCIKGHTKMANVKGATNEEMMEAIWVASEMRAGAAYSYSIIAFDEIEKYQAKQEGKV